MLGVPGEKEIPAEIHSDLHFPRDDARIDQPSVGSKVVNTMTRKLSRMAAVWIVAFVTSTAISSAGFAQDNDERDTRGSKVSATRSGPMAPEDLVVNLAEMTDFTLSGPKQRILNRDMLQQQAGLSENGRAVGLIAVQRTLGVGYTLRTDRVTKNDKALRKYFERSNKRMVPHVRDFRKGEKVKGKARGRFLEFSYRSSLCMYVVANYMFRSTEDPYNGDTQITILYCQAPQQFDRKKILDFIQNARLVDADENRAAYAAREVEDTNQRRAFTPTNRAPLPNVYCYKTTSNVWYVTNSPRCIIGDQQITKAEYDTKTPPKN